MPSAQHQPPPAVPLPTDANPGYFQMLHIKNQSIRPTRVQSPAAQAAAALKYQEKKRKRVENEGAGVNGAPAPAGGKIALAVQVNGGAAASGSHATGERAAKRQAVDRANAAREAAAREVERAARAEKEREELQKRLVLDFNTFTIIQLQRYIALHALAPPIDPSPLSRDQPPPASYLLHPPPPRLPDPTPANRPQRTSRRLLNARTGYREDVPVRLEDLREPIYNDVEAYRLALAGICARHFEAKQKDVKDNDVVVGFVYAIKTRDRTFRVIPVDRATA